jgi:L-serine dehydratase
VAVTISIFDLIKIGVGPSSSHTMGPMLAARQFLLDARDAGWFERIDRIGAQLYGSLALTGKGHCTDRAILLGLEGEMPETLEPATVEARLERIRGAGPPEAARRAGDRLRRADGPALSQGAVAAAARQRHAFHRLRRGRETLGSDTFYSIGGGFIVRGDEPEESAGSTVSVPFPFDDAAELLEQCRRHGMRIHELVLANEEAWRPPRRRVRACLSSGGS